MAFTVFLLAITFLSTAVSQDPENDAKARFVSSAESVDTSSIRNSSIVANSSSGEVNQTSQSNDTTSSSPTESTSITDITSTALINTNQPSVPAVAPDGPPDLPVLLTSQSIPSIFVPEGVYVKTSAAQKACKQNQDCYSMREPDEWCPLPTVANYLDKGCFCDHLRNVCTIQRLTAKGAEFSDCADKSSSKCTGLKPVVRIQQRRH